MTDVFLSYRRDERQAIEQIASNLRALGLSVWFDASMSAGDTFNAEIDREARAAKVILVCWSPAARQSEWVNAEALIGFTQKKLAACYVAGPDEFDPPAPFNATHVEDLRSWLASPSETHSAWKSVLRRVGKLCGRADIESWGALDSAASAVEIRAWIATHNSSPLFMTVDALYRARQTEEDERARLEDEVRQQRLQEDEERRAQEALERREHDKGTAEREEAERRAQGLGPTIIGSMLAALIFGVFYSVVGSLAFIALMTIQWLGESARGDGLTYGSELFAAVGSAYAGVIGARAVIDKFLRAWSGWPTFVLMVTTWVSIISWVLIHFDSAPISRNIWYVLLLISHCSVSSFTAFHFIVRKARAG